METSLFADFETEEERRKREERERSQSAYNPPEKRTTPPQAVPAPPVTSPSNLSSGLFDDMPKTSSGLFDDMPKKPAAQAVPDKPKDLWGEIGEAAGSAWQGAAEMAPSVLEGSEVLINEGLGALGIKGEEKLTNTGGFQLAKQLRGDQAPASQDFEDLVLGAVGQMGAQAGTAFAAGAGAGALSGPAAPIVAPIVGTAVGAFTGVTMGASQAYNEAIAFGADEKTARDMARWGGIIGSTEMIPIARALKFLPKSVRGEVANKLLQKVMHVAGTAGEEAAQEGISQIAQNINAYNHVDINRKLFDDVIQSSVIGGIAGGGLGAVTRPHTAEPDASKTPVVKTDPKSPTVDEAEALKAAGGKPSVASEVRPTATPEELVKSGAVAPDEAAAVLETKGDVAKRISRARDILKGAAPAATTATAPEGPSSEAMPETLAKPSSSPVPPPVPPPSVPQPPNLVPTGAAPGPVTPEVTPPVSPEVVGAMQEAGGGLEDTTGDTIPTVPESSQTLELQREALRSGKRSAVLYPWGTTVPEKVEGKTIYRVNVSGGVLDYDAATRTDENGRKRPGLGKKGIELLDRLGRLNLILDLGPVNKAEVVESIAAGNTPVAVTERTPDGIEVKAAAGTDATAEAQLAALEQSKAAPENIVQVESPEQVIAERVESDQNVTPPPEAAGGVASGQTPSELGSPQPAPEQPLATPPAGEEAVPETYGPPTRQTAEPVTEPEPEQYGPPTPKKTAVIKRISRAKEAKPKANVVEAPKPTPKPEAPKPVIHRTEDAEIDAEMEAFREAKAADAKEEANRKAAAKQAAARAEVKEEQAKARKGKVYDSPEAEQVERLGERVDHLAKAVVEIAKQRARIFFDLIQQAPVPQGLLTSQSKIDAYLADIAGILNEASNQLKAVAKPPSGKKVSKDYVTYSTMPKTKVGYETNTGPVVWMAEAQALVEMNRKAKEQNKELTQKQRNRINSFVGETFALQQGDAEALRSRRQEEGQQASSKAGAQDLSQIAAKTELEPEENTVSAEDLAAEHAAEEAALQVEPDDVVMPEDTTEVITNEEGEATVTAKDATEIGVTAPDERNVDIDDVRGRTGPTASRKGAMRTAGLTEEEQAALAATGRSAATDPALAALKAKIEAELRAGTRKKRVGISEHGISDALTDEQLVDLVEEVLAVADEKGLDPYTTPAAEILALQTNEAGQMADRIANIVDGLSEAMDPNSDLRKYFAKYVLPRIRQMVSRVKVHVVSDEHMDMMHPAPNDWQAVHGYYNHGMDMIVIRASIAADPVALAHVFQHEAVHAMTSHAIDMDRDLNHKLGLLLKYVTENSKLPKDTYGLTDNHEFIAEMFTNPEFQQALAEVQIPKSFWFKNGVPPPSDPMLSNALRAFKLFIARVLKIPVSGKNALEVAMQYGSFALDQGPAAREMYYNPANPPTDLNVHDGPDELLNIDRMKVEARTDPPKSMRDRLEESGVPPDLLDDMVEMIEKDFGGKLTDAQLEALAMEYGKPVTSDADFEGKLAATPPGRGKDIVTDEYKGRGWNRATRFRKFLLKVVTFDYLRQHYRAMFSVSNQKVLDDLGLAIQQHEAYVNKYAQKHEENASLLHEFSKRKPKMFRKLAWLAKDATRMNVNLEPGSSNKHLGVNAMRGLQAKMMLPLLQERFRQLSPEAQKLYLKVVKDYRDAHNETKAKIAENALVSLDLDVKLTKTAFNDLVTKTVNGTLDADDKKLIGSDAYRVLQNAQGLKKIEGDYWPQMRFGEHVVVTKDKIDDPKISSMTLKGTGETVKVNSAVVGGNIVRFWADHSKRGVAAQLNRTVANYVRNNPYQLINVTRKYRDKDGSNRIVSKGEQMIGHDYDLVYDVQLQNLGVSYFESNREAQKFAKQNKGKTNGVFPRYSEQTAKEVFGANPDAIGTRIDNNNRLSDAQKKLVKQVLQEAAISGMASNQSPAKYQARRNVMGASHDIVRSAAVYGRSQGDFMARLHTQPQINEALNKLRAIKFNASKTNPRTGAAQIQVVEEIERRLTQMDSAKEPGALFKTLSTLSFFGTLASPAHSVINSTQVWMNTYPELAGEHGEVQTMAAITHAYLKMGMPLQLLRGVTHTAKAFLQWRKLRIDTSDLMKSIRKMAGPRYTGMFDYMIAHGSLDENSGFETASSILQARNAFTGTMARLDRAFRQMPGMVEVMNRAVTGMAAYNLARRKGMTDAEASAYAHDKTQTTQHDYRKSNLPPFMKQGALAFAMQFRSYAIGQTQLYGDMYAKILAGKSLKERAVATRKLMNLIGMQAAVVGAMGLPGSELVKIAAMILGSMTGNDDEWDEWQEGWSNFIRGLVPGETDWDDLLIEGGVSKLLGLDISSRMSYSDLWTSFGPDQYNYKGWLSYLGGMFAGAPGQQILDATVKAPAKLREGKTDEALELFIPIKIVSDWMKQNRLVAAGEMTPESGIKQIIGFRSSEEAKDATETNKKYMKGSNFAIVGDYIRQRKDLVEALHSAKTAGELAKVKSRIREFNRNKKPSTVWDISIANETVKIREEKRAKRTGKPVKEKAIVWE